MALLNNIKSNLQDKQTQNRVILLLLAVILIWGAYLRFVGINWDDYTHIHPDERFLTGLTAEISTPESFRQYLTTSESPLNVYNLRDVFYVYGNLPMTGTYFAAQQFERLRPTFCGEGADGPFCKVDLTTYDGVHIVGRFLSALLDVGTIALTFLIGSRLYSRRVGLLAAFFMATAAMAIQQSHFYTSDNWSVFFIALTLYSAILISENGRSWIDWLMFGVWLGLAAASRVNVGVMAVVSIIAGIVWIIRQYRTADDDGIYTELEFWQWIRSESATDIRRTFYLGLFTAGLATFMMFRIAMPYAFADSTILQNQGVDPDSLSHRIQLIVGFNPQWRDDIDEVLRLHSPDSTFPPVLQWMDRPDFIHPFINISLWGMGPIAGFLAFAGLGLAGWQIINGRKQWLAHLVPVAWVMIYFVYTGAQFTKIMRYFLPIYPALAVLAAWLIFTLWDELDISTRLAGTMTRLRNLGASELPFLPRMRHLVVELLRPTVVLAAVFAILGSFIWSYAFSRVYTKPITRVAATEWIFDYVPTAATLILDESTPSGKPFYQIPVRDINTTPGGAEIPFVFVPREGVTANAVRLNYVSGAIGEGADLQLSLRDPGGNVISQGSVQLPADLNDEVLEVPIQTVQLEKDVSYEVRISHGGLGGLRMRTSILTSEHWDDSLPQRYNGLDPFSQYYYQSPTGQMTTFHGDNEEKRGQLNQWLNDADYVMISSQRAMWTVPRMEVTFPLMGHYYDSLFDGRLNYDLVQTFSGDIRFGPIRISDVTGRVGFGTEPAATNEIPGILAVEESFSVYEHPPVWIFRKNDSYTPENTFAVLNEVDMSKAFYQNPQQAASTPNGLALTSEQFARQQTGGSFNDRFAVDGVLSNNPLLAAGVWWLLIIVIGRLAFPLCYTLFQGLPDRGYALSKILGLLLISWLAWLGASIGVVTFGRVSLIIATLLLLGVAIYLETRNGGAIRSFLSEKRNLIFFIESLGIVLFIFMLLIRSRNPEVWHLFYGGEKPMDVSYFTAVLKSSTFPPYDPWHAGSYINYYYYGFVFAAVPTLFLGIVPTVAYNLILPMLFSITGLGAFGIGAALTNWLSKEGIIRSNNILGTAEEAESAAEDQNRKMVRGGLAAAIATLILGNLHQLNIVFMLWDRASTADIDAHWIRRALNGAFNRLGSDTPAPIDPSEWFWAASRAIETPQGEVAPITEFPFFTFLYGDLHAHMIALPLSMLALGWAVSLVLSKTKRLTPIQWFVGALAIGSLYPTNSWDYPVQLVIGILAVTWVAIQAHGLKVTSLGRIGMSAIGLFIGSRLLFEPFWSNFGTAYGTVKRWEGATTSLEDFLTIYGLFLLVTLTWLLIDFIDWNGREDNPYRFNSQTVLGLLLGLFLIVTVVRFLLPEVEVVSMALLMVLVAGLMGLRPNISAAKRTINILISSAFGLTLFVELFVLDGDIGRMNTVFKFYMQSWLILAIISGATLPIILSKIKELWHPRAAQAWQISLATLVFLAALYPVLATRGKFEVRPEKETATPTLDGMAFMDYVTYNDNGRQISLAGDYEALKWMQRNISGSPVVAEAHSNNPYRSIGNRVAMYTGLPSIVGWDWHQRQQRPTLPGEVVSNRIQDVSLLYQSSNTAETMRIVEKYDVSFIYAGELEQAYYGNTHIQTFDQLVNEGRLSLVYTNPTTKIYQVVPSNIAAN